ncbi:predicted protein [Thalassiosira pseudonana CCMP1335]|uniref:Uncharacterized protein n=1 Tax=Thalassiosira pseudonana TaxID=35128 RepID=B8C0S5_THAPS|nr:predicted protein [Thalassiosira pseudonana CCMP1335]EED93118.1 predicted protein [Thalassiosira pseudonana CCMP1335]
MVAGEEKAGMAYVYTGSTGKAVQSLPVGLAASQARFGNTVSIYVGKILIDAPTAANKTGSIYMYYLSDDDVWKFSDVIENKGGEVWNMHDSSVSIDANSVVVRVPKNDVDASNQVLPSSKAEDNEGW